MRRKDLRYRISGEAALTSLRSLFKLSPPIDLLLNIDSAKSQQDLKTY